MLKERCKNIYGRYHTFIYGILTMIISWIILSRKLCHSGLWFDEATEYWISKVARGSIPGIRDGSDMYTHIKGTFQPPLYNIILHFWLMIFDSEKGFRYSSVLFVALAAVAFYFLVSNLCENEIMGVSFSVIYISLFCMPIFAQECAEYALLICMLSWTLYFWVMLVVKYSMKRLVLFMMFACMSIYSQYGACFAVAAMTVVLLLRLLIYKEWKKVYTTLIVYAAFLLILGVPLCYFFLLPQISEAHRAVTTHSMTFEGGFFLDFVNSLVEVSKFAYSDIDFKYMYVIYYGVVCLVFISMFLFLFLMSIKIIKRKTEDVLYDKNANSTNMNTTYCWIIIMTTVAYLLYYFAVKAHFYEIYYSGGFYNRYAMAIIPIVYLMCIMPFVIFLWCIKTRNIYGKVCTLFVCISVIFGVIGFMWSNRNWIKCNHRELTAEWLNMEGYTFPTLVSNFSDPLVQFYLVHDENYNEKMQNNIINLDIEEGRVPFVDVLNNKFGTDNWPEQFYCICEIYKDDIDAITEYGYDCSIVDEDLKVNSKLMVVRRK